MQPHLLAAATRQSARWLVRRLILYQDSNITNAAAEFSRERVECLLDHLDEMLTLHPSHPLKCITDAHDPLAAACPFSH